MSCTRRRRRGWRTWGRGSRSHWSCYRPPTGRSADSSDLPSRLRMSGWCRCLGIFLAWREWWTWCYCYMDACLRLLYTAACIYCIIYRTPYRLILNSSIYPIQHQWTSMIKIITSTSAPRSSCRSSTLATVLFGCSFFSVRASPLHSSDGLAGYECGGAHCW